MSERGTQEHRTTREQIIAAAYQVLVEQGYDATTIKQVAKVAGVAPGLLHYYFANKDELLVEVLKEASRRYTSEMRQVSRDTTAERLPQAGIADARRRALETPGQYRLRYELFALGLRNPALLPGVRALLASGREGIANVARLAGADKKADPDALAGILLACFDGLALQRIADPEFDLDGAYALLNRMIESFLQAS